MARTPNSSDFIVPVEGVGDFTFGRRAMRDEIKSQVEYARITEGVAPTPWLHAIATWLSDLKVLTVRAPDGWDIDAMDPLDENTYTRLLKVHAALAAKEGSFRGGPKQASEAPGAAAGAVV